MNVSPFGEWRWSPMGLAGRDPIFYAQLDSEIAFVKEFFKNDPAKVAENIQTIQNTCFRCHGVMGKRRLDEDHGGPGKGNFDRDMVYVTYDTKPAPDKTYIYGALARDGVSCMSCHRIVEDKVPFSDFLKNKITGNFTTGNPAELSGPFEDKEIVTDPMNNAMGIKPKYDAYIKSSRMCGSCHTINLPLMDNPNADPDKPHLEQVTYLEWLNSGYQNEVGTNSKAQTCQNCHMPTKYTNSKGTLNIPLIQQPIAFIEDDQYPQTGNRLPDEKIRVRFRRLTPLTET
jgi:cytochrome c553